MSRDIVAWCTIVFVLYLYTFTVAVPPNSRAMVSVYGSVYKVAKPGMLTLSPFDFYESIVTEIDTDFKDNITCKTYDNVFITIPRIYIDNEFNCTDDDCIKTLYRKYFVSDTKALAKFDNKLVPEDGMIFKYVPEVMTEVCQLVTAYQTQTEMWTSLFNIVKQKLQARVPSGIRIVGVRLERPTVQWLRWKMSIPGMILNKIYIMNMWMYEHMA